MPRAKGAIPVIIRLLEEDLQAGISRNCLFLYRASAEAIDHLRARTAPFNLMYTTVAGRMGWLMGCVLASAEGGAAELTFDRYGGYSTMEVWRAERLRRLLGPTDEGSQ
jgi:hypothetical protein